MTEPEINAYIIPRGADKVLGEDGWEFVSADALSLSALRRLAGLLGLTLTSSFVGIDTYSGEDATMSIVCDHGDEAEFVDLKIERGALARLRSALASLGAGINGWLDAELFIPGGDLSAATG